MNLGELRSELRENILHDRSDRVSGTPDYLWSDASLTRYINEAYRRFARISLILRDSSSIATKVTLQEGRTSYPLHKSVLALLSAKLEGEHSDLVRVGHSLLNSHRPTHYPLYNVADFATISDGRPRAVSTDDEISLDDEDTLSAVTLRVYPAPGPEHAGKDIQMRVIRLPLEPLEMNADIPELPEDYHLLMLDWSAYLALRIADTEVGMPARAAGFMATFDRHVMEARRETLRKLFAPTPWGFGAGGWSWER